MLRVPTLFGYWKAVTFELGSRPHPLLHCQSGSQQANARTEKTNMLRLIVDDIAVIFLFTMESFMSRTGYALAIQTHKNRRLPVAVVRMPVAAKTARQSAIPFGPESPSGECRMFEARYESCCTGGFAQHEEVDISVADPACFVEATD